MVHVCAASPRKADGTPDYFQPHVEPLFHLPGSSWRRRVFRCGHIQAPRGTHLAREFQPVGIDVVITDVNPYRLELARKMGASRALDVRSEKLDDAMKSLQMEEGSTWGWKCPACRPPSARCCAPCTMAGSIALLGLMPQDTGIRWTKSSSRASSLKGVYGREMFRDLVQDGEHAAERPGYFPGDHASPAHRGISIGFETMAPGTAEKSSWTGARRHDAECSGHLQVGIGPSSSHTMGPMNAARRFVLDLAAGGLLQSTVQLTRNSMPPSP